jgi:2-oxoglutarate ferredoxin oxidoreductase subunit beta
LQHDPADLNRAREIASDTDKISIGILYRNPEIPCYEDLRANNVPRTTAYIKAGLEAELDKFTIWPQ